MTTPTARTTVPIGVLCSDICLGFHCIYRANNFGELLGYRRLACLIEFESKVGNNSICGIRCISNGDHSTGVFPCLEFEECGEKHCTTYLIRERLEHTIPIGLKKE